jgi:uncharacterized protein YbaA (DUF1428 family)
MSYFDGYLVPVPEASREEYRKIAQQAAEVFKDCGAIRCVEAWGDDVPDGKVTSFPLAVQRKPDEAVVFSFVEWPSKAARDEGMKQAMADPRMDYKPSDMPFDGMRMMFGGFAPIVDL